MPNDPSTPQPPASPFPTSRDPRPHLATDAGSAGPAQGAAASGAAAIGAAADRLAHTAQDTAHRVAEAAAPLLERARAAGQGVRELEQAWMDSTRACVREHPVSSVLVAFAAGVLLGTLARR